MTDEQMNTPAPAQKSSTMLWWIIGIVAVVLVGGWFVMHSMSSMAVRAVAGANGVAVDQHLDGSATYSTGEGSVTVGGNSLPSDWPKDAPAVYSGGTIQYSGSSNPQTGQAGAVVMYTVKGSAQSVVQYNESELAKNGWHVEGKVTSGPTTILSAKKDTRTMGVSITDAGSGMVQVSAGLEM